MKSLLKVLKSREVDLLAGVGNRGDGLITQGALAFFKENKISVKIIDRHSNSCGDNLVIIGAGGFCKPYKHRIYDTERFYGKYKNIFVVSSSFDTSVKEVIDFLKRIPDYVWIICREKTSFYQVLKYTNRVLLDHDFAFNFNFEPYKKIGNGVLHAFRLDDEKTDIEIPKDNIDISAGRTDSWETLLIEIGKYKTIHTNRLHVGIVGAMLDKEVFLYPNGYHKVESVYKFSLHNNEKVVFVPTHNNYI